MNETETYLAEKYFEGKIETEGWDMTREMKATCKEFFLNGFEHGQYDGYSKGCQEFLDKESLLTKAFKEVN